MRKQALQMLLAFTLAITTGCAGRFDIAGTRAAYAVSASDPSSQECEARVLRAQESFNTHSRWWARSVVAGIVLGTAIGVVAIATGRDTPGDGAATTAEAVDNERGFSKLELTTAALAMAAGADAILAWQTAAGMNRDARQVAGHLLRCPPRPASPSPPPKPLPLPSPSPSP